MTFPDPTGDPVRPAYPTPIGYGYPPGYPGYRPGDSLLGGPGHYPPDPNDPLVTMVGQGFAGWFGRLRAVLARGWRSMLALVVIGWLVPGGLAIGAFVAVFASTSGTGRLDVPGPAIAAAVIVAACAMIVLQTAVLVAIIWTVTKQAYGGPAPLSGALGYGFRRALPVIGWQFLAGLLTVAGLCACVLPGLYVMVATSLLVPIVVFERGAGNPISGSFRLVNRNFGAVLGRAAVLYAPLFVVQIINQVIELATLRSNFPPPGTPVAPPALALDTTQIVLTVVVFVVALVWQAVIAAGGLLTYAEMRARTAYTTTADLTRELDPDAATAPGV
jgi:hypothetical protein